MDEVCFAHATASHANIAGWGDRSVWTSARSWFCMEDFVRSVGVSVRGCVIVSVRVMVKVSVCVCVCVCE